MLGSMMFEGGEIIRERIKRYQIDCDHRPGGLFVAMNDKTARDSGRAERELGTLRQ